MLQLAQRTSAPSEVSVSIRTAVWIVMCSEPVMRAPRNGCSPAYFSRSDMRPGISCCAGSISLRPYSARERSATLKSVLAAVVVVICPPLRGSVRLVRRLRRVPGGARASPAPSRASRRGGRPPGALPAPRARYRPPRASPPPRAAAWRTRRRRGRSRTGPAAHAGCEDAAARPDRRRGSPSRSCSARSARLARGSGAFEATSRSSQPLRSWSGRRSCSIRGNLSTTVSRFGGPEILAQTLAQDALRRRLERGLLAVGEPCERRRRRRQLALQLRRGGHHRRDGEVHDRRPRVLEAGRDADHGHAPLPGAGGEPARGADGHAATALLEAGERLLVVAAVGGTERDAIAATPPAAADDQRRELARAVRDAAHVDRPVRHARRLDAPHRVPDLVRIGEHVVALHRT